MLPAPSPIGVFAKLSPLSSGSSPHVTVYSGPGGSLTTAQTVALQMNLRSVTVLQHRITLTLPLLSSAKTTLEPGSFLKWCALANLTESTLPPSSSTAPPWNSLAARSTFIDDIVPLNDAPRLSRLSAGVTGGDRTPKLALNCFADDGEVGPKLCDCFGPPTMLGGRCLQKAATSSSASSSSVCCSSGDSRVSILGGSTALKCSCGTSPKAHATTTLSGEMATQVAFVMAPLEVAEQGVGGEGERGRERGGIASGSGRAKDQAGISMSEQGELGGAMEGICHKWTLFPEQAASAPELMLHATSEAPFGMR
mmetsp:Transcript_60189/g.142052  ORF Transcript_60189/g.142052 Transcript_60189/m.142052 type:complete len:310 (+) Transcript_60189:6233-7162(+)